MGTNMKKLNMIASLLLSVVMLAGCSFISSGDDLLQTPKPTKNYLLLQDQLEDIMGDTFTYVSPQSGSYRNTVTFEDIDRDGQEEAIAFLREGTGGSVYVHAFKLIDGEYQSIGSIKGSGSALGSVSFMDIDDKEELIVLTWTLSGDVKQGLTVCGLKDGQLTDLLDANYTSYMTIDLDQDQSDELFTVTYDPAGRKTAQLYDYQDGKMIMLSQTDATQDIQTVANITQGALNADGMPAVFVDNKFENDNGMQTDIYVLEKNKLRNVALSAQASTYRSVSLYYSSDVDNDGIIEVPQLQAMPGYENEQAETLWMVDWYCYNVDGSARHMQTTYDSLTEGWSFRFPKNWRGVITARTTSDAGVNQTLFYEVGAETMPLLTIYVFTGDDREEAATAGNLIDLGSTSETCYAAQMGETSGEYRISESQVLAQFSIVQSDWK